MSVLKSVTYIFFQTLSQTILSLWSVWCWLDKVFDVVNLFEIYAGVYSYAYNKVCSIKGFEIKKKKNEKEIPRIKKVPFKGSGP